MFVANETPSPPFSDGACCDYTDAGVAIQYMTVKQRGGIRGIPYLQQKCSQHHIDISSPGS